MTSCCYCGRGLSNPTSIARGCGPICYGKHGPCAGGGGQGGHLADTIVGQAVDRIGPELLRGAAVGFACGALPAACPAILAVNKTATIASAALRVYNAYAKAPTPEAGVHDATKEATKEVASMAISQVVQSGSREDIASVSQTVGRAMGASVSNAFGAKKETVETIARETTHHAIEEGIDGFLSWGVDRSVR